MAPGFGSTADAFDTGDGIKPLPELQIPGAARQMVGGAPVMAPHSLVPTLLSIAGMTERNSAKPAGSSAQLTIFYGGSVHVYDEISPEKAHAIMFLAGSGSSLPSGTALAKSPVPGPSPKLAAGDSVPVSQPTNAPPCSGLSSPISVSSHSGSHSGSGSTNTDEMIAAQITGASTTPVSIAGPPKVANPLGCAPAAILLPSAVPQARKASLARFLEKRKERVMSAAPYSVGKKPAECVSP